MNSKFDGQQIQSVARSRVLHGQSDALSRLHQFLCLRTAIYRTLHITDSEPQLLDVASPALRSLSSDPYDAHRVHLGHFTALTRLELSGYNFNRVQLLWKQSTVQELIAIRCRNVHAPFLVPGAMPALTSIHIEHTGTYNSDSGSSKKQGMLATLMERPHFHQISGDNNFFTAGVNRLLATWHRSAFTQQTIECRTKIPHHKLTVWTKLGHQIA